MSARAVAGACVAAAAAGGGRHYLPASKWHPRNGCCPKASVVEGWERWSRGGNVWLAAWRSGCLTSSAMAFSAGPVNFVFDAGMPYTVLMFCVYVTAVQERSWGKVGAGRRTARHS